MADSRYLANRLKYHTASRVANQTGTSLAATFNVDGHIVRDSSVWTSPLSDFPLQSAAQKKNADPIGATEDLVAVFKNGATSKTFWKGGLVWENPTYPAVKLYENVTLTPVVASLGYNVDANGKNTGTARYQAYEILASAEDGISSGDIRVTNWVAPPAIIDPDTGSPVAGYTGLQMLDGTPLQKVTLTAGNDMKNKAGVAADQDTKWGLGGGHWEFVYMAGILTFEMGVTPEEISKQSTSGLTLTAFKYDGDMLSDTTETIETDITTINNTIADLTIAASAKELKTVSVTIPNSGAIISGAVSGSVTDGAVSALVTGEVMLTKQAGIEITPDMSYVSGVTTLEADYGTTIPASGVVWEITYRV